MGKSFDKSSRQKSSAILNTHTVIYDSYSDFYYRPFWDADSLKIMEFRLQNKDTIYKRIEKVDYIIGSGQHTNSHMYSTNGYLRQMPMTFYTQMATWDLPPGFEKGFNTRFNRLIGLECMTCHNSFPKFVEGSENKYSSLPNGINCERCHGPGSMHVREKMAGNLIDTSKAIDYTIVNPGKLPIDLQFDVCQRCHLQGNAVLKNDHSFYDFKPGKKLSDYMSVFLPKYKGAEDEFIMASHADRLKMSACFIKSFIPSKSENSLRPYKQSLTCVTCHNPHVSVKATGQDVFNTVCKNCHKAQKSVTDCSENMPVRMAKNGDNCVNCHMPKSNTLDIPHVTTTDHFIRVPVTHAVKKATKTFLGLYSINEKNPTAATRCEAYINQFEKFDNNPMLLDSAAKYADDKSTAAITQNFDLIVRLQFCKRNYSKIQEYVAKVGMDILLNNQNPIFKKSFDNKNAWTLYRVGEAYTSSEQHQQAYLFYKYACKLAPENLEFKNKLGASLSENGKIVEAQKVFESIVKSDPKFAAALSNYGYSFLLAKNIETAEMYFDKALQIDPDLEIALLNKAGVLLYKNNTSEAKKMLLRVLKINPKNNKAKAILTEI
ncbi:MAG: tetratricopeptide repeat protein [Bacteroidetes bacterium]|nr:tetratricopeptide repeat protein [Bacteroidota bacterium]